MKTEALSKPVDANKRGGHSGDGALDRMHVQEAQKCTSAKVGGV